MTNIGKALRLTITQTRLWLHSSGIIDVSPDGIIDDETIFELKHLFTGKEETFPELIGNKHAPFLTLNVPNFLFCFGGKRLTYKIKATVIKYHSN